MAEINKQFITELQGKTFITYNGLVDLAHQMELKSITTELIQIPTADNNNQCIMKATATTHNGQIFEGYGDADPANVNSMIRKHLIRMAETRAKARALRDLTNVGMTAIEELGEEDIESTPEPNTPKKPTTTTQSNNNPKQDIINNSLASDAQVTYIDNLCKKKNYTEESIKAYMTNAYKKTDVKTLTKS